MEHGNFSFRPEGYATYQEQDDATRQAIEAAEKVEKEAWAAEVAQAKEEKRDVRWYPSR